MKLDSRAGLAERAGQVGVRLPGTATSLIIEVIVLSFLLGLTNSVHAADNFLIISLDDVGVDKIGIYSDDVVYGHPGEGGAPGPTPMIDAMAAQGILFRNAYANTTCSPTRAATLTGRHGFRTGIGFPADVLLPFSETLLPELLFATHGNAAIGKWHLSPDAAVNHPTISGFSHYAGGIEGILPSYFDWTKVTNGVSQNILTYATTETVSDALVEINNFGVSPWLMWLAFNAPHDPFHAPPAGLHTQVLAGDPVDTPVEHYAAALEALDSELARLFAGIPANVLADTTIIVFGDNGTPGAAVEAPFLPNRAKTTMYEGGINVPFIVKSPHIPAIHEGSESLSFVHAVDIFATVAQIAGVPTTAEDSVSFLPLLLDPTQPGNRPIVYSEGFRPNGFGPYTIEQRALRYQGYKVIWRDGVYEELYDLDNDPFEMINLLPGPLNANEQAAFDVLQSENDRLHPPSVPSLTFGTTLLLAITIVLLGAKALRRSRAISLADANE